jgi:hypothetical protein
MPSDALTRDAIVSVLDDLGEREQISSAWLEDENDQPYLPKAVHERSQRLRERLQLRRGAFIVLMLLVGLAGGLGTAGWTIPGALTGFFAGFGGGFVAASLFTDPWAEEQMRALQLYDLLKEIDEPFEAASEASTVEAP